MADQNVSDTASAVEAKGDAAVAPAVESAARGNEVAVAAATKPAEAAAQPSARKPAARRVKAAVKSAARTVRKAAISNTKPAAKPAVETRKPVRAGVNRKIEGVNPMNKQTQKTVDAGLFAADQFQNVFGDVNARAKAAAERSAKVAEELADLTRGNVEAFVASSKIAAKGVEALSQDAAEYGRKTFEEASATLRNFAEVKSATDLFRLQGEYARAAFDNAVAESARLSETMLKLAGEVAEPITNRYTVAAERVKTLAA